MATVTPVSTALGDGTYRVSWTVGASTDAVIAALVVGVERGSYQAQGSSGAAQLLGSNDGTNFDPIVQPWVDGTGATVYVTTSGSDIVPITTLPLYIKPAVTNVSGTTTFTVILRTAR